MKEDPVWLRSTVAVIVRIAYFLIGNGIALYTVSQGMVRSGSFSGSQDDLAFAGLFCFACGIASMLFGPYLYREATMRGRGKLEEIREKSRGCSYWKPLPRPPDPRKRVRTGASGLRYTRLRHL